MRLITSGRFLNTLQPYQHHRLRIDSNDRPPEYPTGYLSGVPENPVGPWTPLRGRRIHTHFRADNVDETFYGQDKFLRWISHEAYQHLLTHPLSQLLNADYRCIWPEDTRMEYQTYTWFQVQWAQDADFNKAPCLQKSSHDWDADPEGDFSNPLACIRVSIPLFLEQTNTHMTVKNRNTSHICDTHPHPLEDTLFAYIIRQHGLEVAIVPPRHRMDLFPPHTMSEESSGPTQQQSRGRNQPRSLQVTDGTHDKTRR